MNAPRNGSTRFYPVVHTAQTGSTNTDVLAEASRGAEEGFTALTDYQTDGRGRQGRRWEARPKDALLMSVLLRPDQKLLGSLPMLAGLAIQDVLTSLADVGVMAGRIELKWPNDVIVVETETEQVLGKVAGILVESRLFGPETAVAVGIGVNLQIAAMSDSSALSNAVSLEWLVGSVPEQRSLLDQVLAALEKWLLVLEDGAGGPEAVLSEYRSRCYTVDREINFAGKDGKLVTGRATGIAANGGLCVTVDNQSTVLNSGDVHLEGF